MHRINVVWGLASPFVRAGIPAGSIATGAGGVKSVDGRAAFGGVANAAYDTCYHNACDTTANINSAALAEMVAAAAYAMIELATNADTLV
eukprot:m.539932 g.539932  ORF g.539932 m.539932 type:complete len:90 (-) comp22095_c0_seq3:3177-3446(-)